MARFSVRERKPEEEGVTKTETRKRSSGWRGGGEEKKARNFSRRNGRTECRERERKNREGARKGKRLAYGAARANTTRALSK